MFSMTGYGKGTGVFDGRELTIELKSVNHRFLDLTVKLPRTLLYAEDAIRKVLQGKLSRGHVDVYVTLVDKREGATSISIDKTLVSEYARLAKEISDETGAVNDFSTTFALRIPDAITTDVKDQEGLTPFIVDCTEKAVLGLLKMRESEGGALKNDLVTRVNLMREMLDSVKERAPLVAEEYRVRLTEKISELLSGEFDETRILQEVAIFTDKANIDEEITRLSAHFERFDEYMTDSEPVGRRLDFLVQEMNREINTMGSKSNDVTITEKVLALKNELEKIREQVQNVE